MSRIVKAVSVVDDSPRAKRTFADVVEAGLPQMSVIKRQLFDYRENPYADQTLLMPDKQGYISELNRIKVQIAQAKAELRSLGRNIEDTLDEHEAEALKALENPEAPEPVSPIILKAQTEAERITVEAKEKAAAMMADCEAEGFRIAEEARNNGYLEGFDKGFAEAQNEFKLQNDPKIQELDNLLEHISAYSEEMLAQNEKDMLALVMTVCKKVLGREIKEDPRAIVPMLYQTLDDNRREEDIRITVSTELMPVEVKASNEIKKLIAQTAPSATISVNEDLDPGTVVVETGGGITDLSVDTQLENIKNMLTED